MHSTLGLTPHTDEDQDEDQGDEVAYSEWSVSSPVTSQTQYDDAHMNWGLLMTPWEIHNGSEMQGL